MLKVAICDDEPSMRRRLANYVERFSQETQDKIAVLEFASGQDLLTGCRCTPDIDIILLDIKMDHEADGLTAALQIRKFSPDVLIIFITSMIQFALYGYQVRAFGFLEKPVQYKTFRREFSAGAKKAKERQGTYLLIPALEKGSQVQVSVSEIMYCEVRNHNVLLQTESKTMEFRGQLKQLEKSLEHCGFFRCHASYLVNQRYISRIEPSQLQLADGTYIPISKQRHKTFLTALTDYVGGQMV